MCDEFIHREILDLTIRGALTRGETVYHDANENEKKNMREAIKKFLKQYFDEIRTAAEGQILDETIHRRKILRLSEYISEIYGHILLNGRLNIGRAQKLVNLYLKYIWRLGWIKGIPPHCPFDRIVLEKGLHRYDDNWTQVDDIETYDEWVRCAQQVINNNENIAEWEYRNYPIWNRQPPY